MSEWISVKDKLPENRIWKIVYCEDQSITMMYYDPEKKYWVSQMGFDRYDVLAWMNKPEPPCGLTKRAADEATGICKCGYMAKYPICTKCGRAYPPRR